MTPRINFFRILIQAVAYVLPLYSVSQKKIHPLKFSDIFSQTVGNFSQHFTCLLYIPIYAGLQIFIQLSATVTRF